MASNGTQDNCENTQKLKTTVDSEVDPTSSARWNDIYIFTLLYCEHLCADQLDSSCSTACRKSYSCF